MLLIVRADGTNHPFRCLDWRKVFQGRTNFRPQLNTLIIFPCRCQNFSSNMIQGLKHNIIIKKGDKDRGSPPILQEGVPKALLVIKDKSALWLGLKTANLLGVLSWLEVWWAAAGGAGEAGGAGGERVTFPAAEETSWHGPSLNQGQPLPFQLDPRPPLQKLTLLLDPKLIYRRYLSKGPIFHPWKHWKVLRVTLPQREMEAGADLKAACKERRVCSLLKRADKLKRLAPR